MVEQVSYIPLSHFFLKQKKKTELNEIKLGFLSDYIPLLFMNTLCIHE